MKHFSLIFKVVGSLVVASIQLRSRGVLLTHVLVFMLLSYLLGKFHGSRWQDRIALIMFVALLVVEVYTIARNSGMLLSVGIR